MAISEIELKVMAKTACNELLEKGTPLNDTLVKMASERDMNAHHVARLVERANLDAYDAMWKKHGSGDFQFDLADQDHVVSKLEKSAEILPDDYDIPGDALAKALKKTEPKKEEIKTAEAMVKTASDKLNEEKFNVKLAAMEVNKLRDSLKSMDALEFQANVSIKEAEIEIRDMLKVAALNGENVPMALVAVQVARPEHAELARAVFAKAAAEVPAIAKNIQKFAKVINENALGEVAEGKRSVNGGHSLLRHIDTLADCNGAILRLHKAKDYVVKKTELLNDRVLKHTEDYTHRPDIKNV